MPESNTSHGNALGAEKTRRNRPATRRKFPRSDARAWGARFGTACAQTYLMHQEDRRRIEALLEQLIQVLQRMPSRSPTVAQPHAFAATLPRYEFKNRSIFPALEDATCVAPLSPLRARAELRTLLAGIAIAEGGSGSSVANTFLRVLDRASHAHPAIECVTAYKALPATAGPDQPATDTLTAVRAALTAYARACEDGRTISATASPRH
jgi:hypothetical protein